jgi:hypothetical protein
MSFHICSKCGNSYTKFGFDFSPAEASFIKKHLYTHKDQYHKEYNQVDVEFYKCPNTECNQVDLLLKTGNDLGSISKWIIPISNAKSYPNINPTIGQLYKEAHAVLSISISASVALARACLEHILIKEFALNGKLVKMIETLEDNIKNNSVKLDTSFINAFHALREAGNSTLHADINIDLTTEDAELLLKVLEMLLDEIYINRVHRTESLNRIDSIRKRVEEKRDVKKNTD